MESYSGAHPESIEELLNWPYRRFVAAYTAWQRRKLAEEWENKKTAHIMALYANTNMDLADNDREGKIRVIGESYDHVIESIRSNITPDKKKEMSKDETNFMKAAQRGQALIAAPSMPGEQTIARLSEL